MDKITKTALRIAAGIMIFLYFPCNGISQSTGFAEDITAEDLQNKVSLLASDSLEGRMTGSEGAKKAAAFIARRFAALNLQYLPGKDSYYFPFEYVKGVEIVEGKNRLSYEGQEFELYKDFIPLTSGQDSTITAGVVFAGYGVKVKDGDFDYNSYEKIDVKGKIVMILDGIPENLSEAKKDIFQITLASGYKQMLARQMGAKGILVVKDALRQDHDKPATAGAGIATLAITQQTADQMLAGENTTVEALKTLLADGNPAGNKKLFPLKGKATIEIRLRTVKGKDNNVCAMIPAAEKDADYIFIGAHYDHLGHGEINSRAKGEHKNMIHNGADDNASGTATVLELAEYFAGIYRKHPEKIKNNLVFCLWSGEELGLLGSSAFTANMPVDTAKIKAYVNFDMVGALRDNKLEMQGTGSAGEWKEILTQLNADSTFNLLTGEDPYLPTDVTSFYLKHIPVINFFTGIEERYHTDLDDTEYIRFDGMEKITRFASKLIFTLMEKDLTYRKAKMQGKRTKRFNISVSLGTIPQYSGGDGTGMLLQGVSNGGAAEKAGLKAGDKIIEMNGKTILNIYDFMNVMVELKPNVKTTVKIIRDGKTMTLPLIPQPKNR